MSLYKSLLIISLVIRGAIGWGQAAEEEAAEKISQCPTLLTKLELDILELIPECTNPSGRIDVQFLSYQLGIRCNTARGRIHWLRHRGLMDRTTFKRRAVRIEGVPRRAALSQQERQLKHQQVDLQVSELIHIHRTPGGQVDRSAIREILGPDAIFLPGSIGRLRIQAEHTGEPDCLLTGGEWKVTEKERLVTIVSGAALPWDQAYWRSLEPSFPGRTWRAISSQSKRMKIQRSSQVVGDPADPPAGPEIVAPQPDFQDASGYQLAQFGFPSSIGDIPVPESWLASSETWSAELGHNEFQLFEDSSMAPSGDCESQFNLE
ncbi:MAG: hypothetical protein LBI20_02170 [Holosporales bacterium]|jgi:hypothetical protein|nr:hypothetical protein [Holosporales bacterium]